MSIGSVNTPGGWLVEVKRKLSDLVTRMTSAERTLSGLSGLSGTTVPNTRKINNKPLSSDITLNAGDVGAAAAGHTHTPASIGAAAANHTHTAAQVGAVPASGTAAAANKLATAREIDGMSFDGSDSVTHYAVCSTDAGNAGKTVSCSGFSLVTGARIAVKFVNGDHTSQPLLNVNSTGSRYIKAYGTTVPFNGMKAGEVIEFIFDGTYWQKVGSSQAMSLADSMMIDGIYFDGTKNVTHYATCSTPASTEQKDVSCDNFCFGTYPEAVGKRITVKFDYANTAPAPTLKVASCNPKAIKMYGTTAPEAYLWQAGAVIEFIFDGTYWQMVGMAAVKAAYDKASAAPFVASTEAPTDKTKLWIDTTPTTGGLKYWNGSTWAHVPVAYS